MNEGPFWGTCFGNSILYFETNDSVSDYHHAEGFLIPLSSSLTPAGCPTIQLNFDALYLDVASDPTYYGFGSTGPSSSPTSDPDHKSKLAPELLTNCYRGEVPTIPFLGSSNLLEWLTDIQRNFFFFLSLQHWFILKGYNPFDPEQSNERDAWKKMWGTGPELPSPFQMWHPRSPNHHIFANLEALRTLSFGGFTEASLHRHDWLNHWPLGIEHNLQPPLSSLEVCWGEGLQPQFPAF